MDSQSIRTDQQDFIIPVMKKALVIGINNYENAKDNELDLQNLSTCVNDACGVINFLQSCKYDIQTNISDDDKEQQISCKVIDEIFQKFLTTAKCTKDFESHSCFFIFYSGHGVISQDARQTCGIDSNGELIPFESYAYELSQYPNVLSFFFLDCCRVPSTLNQGMQPILASQPLGICIIKFSCLNGAQAKARPKISKYSDNTTKLLQILNNYQNKNFQRLLSRMTDNTNIIAIDKNLWGQWIIFSSGIDLDESNLESDQESVFSLEIDQLQIEELKQMQNQEDSANDVMNLQEIIFQIDPKQSEQLGDNQTIASEISSMFLNMDEINIIHQYQDPYCDQDKTIMRASNGKVFIGGDHTQLKVFGDDLLLLTSITLSDELKSGIAIGNQIFCGQSDQVTVYNGDNLSLIQTIETQNLVTKILQIDDDYLLLGEWYGYIDIIQISTLSIVFQAKLKQKEDIYDINKTPNTNEYAFALHRKGLVFGMLQQDNASSQYTFVENKNETYFEDRSVCCIASVNANYLIAGVQGNLKLVLIDRSSKQVIKYFSNYTPDGNYNSLQKVIGYDDTHFPYLLFKDEEHVTIINTHTLEAHKIIECKYDDLRPGHSMIQFKDGNQLKLLTLFYDNKVGSVKEYIVGNFNT